MATTYTQREIREIIFKFRSVFKKKIGCPKCRAEINYPDFYYTQSDIGIPKCPGCGAKLSLEKLEKELKQWQEKQKTSK